MIPKTPKTPPLFQRFLGGLIILEAAVCGGSYLVWRKLNNSRDFREKAKDSAPWVLEWYYKMGEMVNDSYKVIRESDETIWAYNKSKKSEDGQR